MHAQEHTHQATCQHTNAQTPSFVTPVYTHISPPGLCAELLHATLGKDARVRCSNWEQVPLDTHQRRYAAADACASLRCYEVCFQGGGAVGGCCGGRCMCVYMLVL